MARDHNKRLARRVLTEIYGKGDVELANELVHPDFVDHEPAHPEQPIGPESVKETVRHLHAAFGVLRFEVEDAIAEGRQGRPAGDHERAPHGSPLRP